VVGTPPAAEPEHHADRSRDGVDDRKHHQRPEAGERNAAVLNHDRVNVVPEQAALVRGRPYVCVSSGRAVLGPAVEVVQADVLGILRHADHGGSPQHDARRRKCDDERRNNQ
jgi:hypothetical protein